MLRQRKSSFCILFRMFLVGMLVFQPLAFGAAEGPKSESQDFKVGIRFQNGKELHFQKCAQVDAAAQAEQVTSEASSDCLDLTPLHVAAMAYPGKVEGLLEASADPDATATGNLTPLHVALQSGQYDSAAILLKYGADPVAVTDSGALPLHLLYVAECGSCEEDTSPAPTSATNRQEIARLLLSEGAQINGIDSTGATPLHYAVMDPAAALEKVDELRELGADVGIRDNNGTPLSFYAALAGNTAAAERVRLLAGHSVDEVDSDGVGKEAWVTSKRSELESIVSSFQPEVITQTTSSPSGLSFHSNHGFWFDFFCNVSWGIFGCFGVCWYFAPTGPGGVAACTIACGIWSWALCYAEQNS